MTNLDPTKLDWAAGLLAGWTYDKPVNKWFQGAFRHAHRLTRPCPTCSDTIVLDVTAKALEGKATNHGLALRRCKTCRKALKAGPQVYAERKAAIADKPTPVVVQPAVQKDYGNQSPTVIAVGLSELETLRTANATMKEELEGLYMQLKELRGQQRPAETIGFRPPAKPPEPATYRRLSEPLTMAQSVKNMQAALAAKNNAKMPWEGG